RGGLRAPGDALVRRLVVAPGSVPECQRAPALEGAGTQRQFKERAPDLATRVRADFSRRRQNRLIEDDESAAPVERPAERDLLGGEVGLVEAADRGKRVARPQQEAAGRQTEAAAEPRERGRPRARVARQR